MYALSPRWGATGSMEPLRPPSEASEMARQASPNDGSDTGAVAFVA
jgi:hypothetical protein